MALIVEDGSAKPDAESWCSVAHADQYHSSLGNDEWGALSISVKEQTLRKGTNYLMQEYGMKWAGYRTTSTQALDWPRTQVPIPDLQYAAFIPDDVIPIDIQNACASLGLRSTTEDLTENETRQVVREKVDVIEIQYSENSTTQKQYTEIDNMLGKYLKGGSSTGGALPMVRV
jgi:hypothetical protein